MRGKDARNTKNTITKKTNKKPPTITFIHKNKTLQNIDIHKILAYSAIKIRANFKPPYSTLKPDTSSDSPSARSKGARFVSTTQQTKKIKKIGSKNDNQKEDCLFQTFSTLKLKTIKTNINSTNEITIS